MDSTNRDLVDYDELEKKYSKLNKRQKIFCLHILSGRSATDSYILAYDLPRSKYNSAAASASRLKKSPLVRDYLTYSKARQLNELRDILNPAAIVEELMREAFSKNDDNMRNKMRSLEILVFALGLNSNLIDNIKESEKYYLDTLGELKKDGAEEE